MIDLFLPFILGVSIGINPPVDSSDSMETTVNSNVSPAVEAVSDTNATGRTPEPQVATGKFTTALEIRPILGMTKTSWAVVRLYDGQDLVYFTHLMAWRCGLWEIRYGVNGDPADTIMPMEPCNEEFAQPNVMNDIENFLPYVSFPGESITSVQVEITYDDGMIEVAQFERGEILIP